MPLFLSYGMGYRRFHCSSPILRAANPTGDKLDLYADVHYPREMIEHHLIGGLRTEVLIRNSLEPAGGGEWGIINGMRIIRSKKWITDELDCFKQHRVFKP